MLDQKKSPRPPAARSTVDIVRSLVAAGEILQVHRLTLAQRAAVKLRADTGIAELQIRAATMDDLPIILGLIEEAKGWLRTKGTDQWSTDWPDGSGKNRSDRVAASLAGGRTWLVWFAAGNEKTPAATVTVEESASPAVWPELTADDEKAAYLSRLVTARKFSGLGIGAALLDWSCTFAARKHQAKLIRIDVWTDNYTLHDYYKEQGFRPAGFCPNVTYPSRARFEKFTSDTDGSGSELSEA